MLSREEEIAEFKKYRQTKSAKVREKLVESCLKLVFSLARKYWLDRDPESLQALISAGNVGLMEAVDKFDPDRGARFASYASFWILMHIRTELTTLHDVVVPSSKARKLRMRASSTRKSMGIEDAPSPSSMYSKLEDMCEIQIGCTTSDVGKSSSYEPGSSIPDTDVTKLFSRWFRFLTVREQFVLRAYYGLLGEGEGLKLRQISAHLGLSSERVRQIKASALNKLRRWFSYDGVEAPQDVM